MKQAELKATVSDFSRGDKVIAKQSGYLCYVLGIHPQLTDKISVMAARTEDQFKTWINGQATDKGIASFYPDELKRIID